MYRNIYVYNILYNVIILHIYIINLYNIYYTLCIFIHVYVHFLYII